MIIVNLDKEKAIQLMQQSNEMPAAFKFTITPNPNEQIITDHIYSPIGTPAIVHFSSHAKERMNKSNKSPFKSRLEAEDRKEWYKNFASNKKTRGMLPMIHPKFGKKKKYTFRHKRKRVRGTAFITLVNTITRFGYIEYIDSEGQFVTINSFELNNDQEVSNLETYSYAISNFEKIINELNEFDPIIVEVSVSVEGNAVHNVKPIIPSAEQVILIEKGLEKATHSLSNQNENNV